MNVTFVALLTFKNILCPMNVTVVALLTFKNILCPMNVTFVALLTFKNENISGHSGTDLVIR